GEGEDQCFVDDVGEHALGEGGVEHLQTRSLEDRDDSPGADSQSAAEDVGGDGCAEGTGRNADDSADDDGGPGGAEDAEACGPAGGGTDEGGSGAEGDDAGAQCHAPDEVRHDSGEGPGCGSGEDRKSTRLNSSHVSISYAVFCLK